MSINRKLISGLWVGDALPTLAELSIRSYLAQGYDFQLFSYKKYKNIPEGAIFRDASEIIPREEVFYHSNGSLSPFGDWFRYTFLAREGGFWSDLDMVCLKPGLPEEMPWFALEDPHQAALGVVGFPAGHPLVEALAELGRDPAAIVPWDNYDEIHAKNSFQVATPDVEERRKKASWGVAGPWAFTRALQHFNLMSVAAPPSSIYPVHYTAWRWNFDGTFKLTDDRFAEAWGLHLWGELVRREPDAWDYVSPNSVVAQLIERYMPQLHDTPETKAPAVKKKVKILVGICTGRHQVERRKAVRETWLAQKVEGVEAIFFHGKGPVVIEHPDDTVTLNVHDGYNELPLKVKAFFQHALAHYDFDWLFKCDDDTYLALDRLKTLIDEKYDLIGDELVSSRGAPSGGAGYLLSRQLVEKLATLADFPHSGPEDLIVGELATHKFAARCRADSRLCMSTGRVPRSNNDMISAHWCSPQKLREIHRFYEKTPARVYHGKHWDWEDDLQFYNDGAFARKSSGCSGTWVLEHSGDLQLKWSDWPADLLKKEGLSFSSEKLHLTPLAG